jgi:zinc protease
MKMMPVKKLSAMVLSSLLSSFLASSLSHGSAERAYVTTKLKNGLEVISLTSNKVPLVTIVLGCKAGAMTETADINGLTHLWEHMFFKGNKRLPNQEAFNRRIRELGIQYNGDTSAETVRYYFTLPSVFLEDGMQFMSDAISTPLLEEKELERERRVVMDEYDRSASSPGFDRHNLTRQIFYGDLGYRRDPLGDRDIISKTTRQQLLRIKDEVFVPSNCAIFVGGDVTTEQVQKLSEKHFAKWSNPKNWKLPALVEFPALKETIDFVMTRPHVENAMTMLQWNGPRAKSESADSFAADVLISLLQHRSGKFYKKYIDSGLTFGAGLGYYTQSQAGELSIYSESKPENAIKLRGMLLKEPEEWLKPNYFSAEQLEDIRRGLLIDHKREMNTASSFMKTLTFWWSVTGFEYYDSYLTNLRKIEIKDIQAFVKKYLIGKHYVSSILMSPKAAESLKIKDTSEELIKRFPIKKANP